MSRTKFGSYCRHDHDFSVKKGACEDEIINVISEVNEDLRIFVFVKRTVCRVYECKMVYYEPTFIHTNPIYTKMEFS